jgi:2-polyprenyl-6-methoxyphenol hydroxylase-like FAD-dependent oxidoreductase
VAAYVLAGEISRSPQDIPNALVRYQEEMRPYITSVQRLIPGAPQIANPQTAWGVWAFNKTTGFLSMTLSPILAVAGKFFPAFGGTGWPLPDYGVTEAK